MKKVSVSIGTSASCSSLVHLVVSPHRTEDCGIIVTTLVATLSNCLQIFQCAIPVGRVRPVFIRILRTQVVCFRYLYNIDLSG